MKTANRTLSLLSGAVLGIGIAAAQPILTVTASPSSLWPPDGRMVSVTVSGTISGANLAPQATFSVHDEYGEIQPTGATSIGPGGAFSFPILLQASRQGTDLNGRRYSITVTTSNSLGTGFGTTVVVVPHDSSPLPSITGITVCSPTGAGGSTASCDDPNLFDTAQFALAPIGTTCPGDTDANGRCPINDYPGLGVISDEHSTVFPPGALGQNDYMFWVASATGGHSGLGGVVLSGGSGPDSHGQWTLNFADGYGSATPVSSGIPVFLPPFHLTCPDVPSGDPTQQDATFDLNYAAPGTVFRDPTGAPESLLMLYEGVNSCAGITTAINPSDNSYISVGVATSLDNGMTWPVYKTNFVPLPLPYPAGPNAGLGAFGNEVCEGDCALSVNVPQTYGRYAALTPITKLSNVILSGAMINDVVPFGYGEPSAFVDAAPGRDPYVYAVHGYHPSPLDPPLPNGQDSDLVLARAPLNGTSPLNFMKWDGQGFKAMGLGGLAGPILPLGAYENCGDPTQTRHMGSISYVESTGQYLLTFVCHSPTRPKTREGFAGAAWFYSTSYDLSDPAQWTLPLEITGSWSETPEPRVFKGWYPTWMTPGLPAGHLSTTGYVFYLFGPTGGGGGGRRYSSRQFAISIGQ